MSGQSDALKHRFLVQSQREHGLSLEEAELIADFCAGLGDEMLRTISPILSRYKESLAASVRHQVIDEILEKVGTGGPYMNRKALVTQLQVMKMPLQPVVPQQRKPVLTLAPDSEYVN